MRGMSTPSRQACVEHHEQCAYEDLTASSGMQVRQSHSASEGLSGQLLQACQHKLSQVNQGNQNLAGAAVCSFSFVQGLLLHMMV